MNGRTIAIGDIHGCARALDAVLNAVRPTPRDVVVTLGDYIDRGPDSRGVVERLARLNSVCNLVPIMGNHEEMLLRVLAGDLFLIDEWLRVGGEATLDSYAIDSPREIPDHHVGFLRSLRPWHESPTHLFLHANYDPQRSLKKQPAQLLRWVSIHDQLPGPHRSRKTAIVGHASQKAGQILDLGYVKCIDTWVYGNGWLTAFEVNSGQIWQSDRDGRLRG